VKCSNTSRGLLLEVVRNFDQKQHSTLRVMLTKPHGTMLDKVRPMHLVATGKAQTSPTVQV